MIGIAALLLRVAVVVASIATTVTTAVWLTAGPTLELARAASTRDTATVWTLDHLVS